MDFPSRAIKVKLIFCLSWFLLVCWPVPVQCLREKTYVQNNLLLCRMYETLNSAHSFAECLGLDPGTATERNIYLIKHAVENVRST